jgi:hypothetical protein
MTVAAGGAGQPIHALHSPERPDGIVLTLGVYAAMCLAASGQTEQKPLAIVERGRLAMKVGDGRGGVIDLSPEEVVLIRQNVGAGANAVAAAQLYDALGSP